jgi:predicted transcriptional regulator
MSIKPRWAKELYSGEKTVEFRKSSPPIGSLVFLYESAPVRAVTGAFLVSAVLSAEAGHVWAAMRPLKSVWKPGSVKSADLFGYAGGAHGECCAILAAHPVRFPDAERVILEKFAVRPPQSWQSLRRNHFNENALACVLLEIFKNAVSGGVPNA